MMSTFRVAVAIATRGRPSVVARCLAALKDQSHPIDRILIACNSGDDIPHDLSADKVDVLYGPAGLTKQRNNALAHLPADTDLVIFFDDDFVAHGDYVKAMVALFTQDAGVAGATGDVVADGINGKAIEFEDALRRLRTISVDPTKPTLVENFSPYGCNMAFRRASLAGLTFDERLVLYGWQEDRDFGAQVARRGRIVRLNTACGIHLGFRGGRVPGIRLGYSQVINPLYLHRKSNMTLAKAVGHIAKNMLANAVKTFILKDGEDRAGRLKGNALAVVDVLRGRLEPEKVLRL
jgi:GT2 family glycosyltransferase